MCTWGAPRTYPPSRAHEISPPCSGVASYFTGNFLTYYYVIAVCKRRTEEGIFTRSKLHSCLCTPNRINIWPTRRGKGERRWHLCADFFDALVWPEIARANTYRPYPASSDKPFLSENTSTAITHGQLSAVYKD